MTAKRKLMPIKYISKHDGVQTGQKNQENACKKRGRLSETRTGSLLKIIEYIGKKLNKLHREKR